ncbi:6-phosphogluconolactonase, partial [Candidatus Saccharibacteria bacterium]|nr:6-phosphogluconolactonase [Candidatus Saccharibacteria bacterium]
MNTHTFDSPIAVAEEAARLTVELLSAAITKKGSASFVLAGGSTPNLAYGILADQYLEALDWSKVTFLIGDERIGPLDGPDNNWQLIEELFLQHIPKVTFLRPHSNLRAEEAATSYQKAIEALSAYDVTWLGMGPDGHTLSLFPGHPDFSSTETRLVVPIHNSPKPPASRISLSLHALAASKATIILATGESKREAVTDALQPTST